VVVDLSGLEVEAQCNKTCLPVWQKELKKGPHNHDVHRHNDKKQAMITATMMTTTTDEEGRQRIRKKLKADSPPAT